MEMQKVNNEILYKIKPLFTDIRFYMGNTVLDGMFGEAFTDNLDNPKFALLHARNYLFISGEISESKLKKVLQNYDKVRIIPSDNLKPIIEKLYGEKIIEKNRYSLKKNSKFDINKLEKMIEDLPTKYQITKIDENLANRIKEENFLSITIDYKNYGIGYCVIYNNDIIAVATSSAIVYKNGIEVNIKVKEEYQRQGIASALAAKLILECLKQNKEVSWDAANLISLKLAQKLGFIYDSTYSIYEFV